MSIDLHSLDIGGQPRNRVHRSPIRILISKEKKRKRDSIARHRTNFSISSILQSIASTPTNPPHLFLHEKILRAWTTMDHFPFWLTVARGGIARLLLARRKREENSTSSCFLFAGVHDISEPWMDSFTFSPTISQTWRIYPLFNRVENREHRSAFVRVLEIHDCWNSWRNLNQVST